MSKCRVNLTLLDSTTETHSRLRAFMAKIRSGKRDLHTYTIRGTDEVVKAGDCVLIRPPPEKSSAPPGVAHVEGIEADDSDNVKLRVRWYNRPEDSWGGRREFHGAKELFLSDCYDLQCANAIEGKCTVHTFKAYVNKLPNVGPKDFYYRFVYKAATGTFVPDSVIVYCKCELPYNPDQWMIQCEECKDWYHPSCVGMSVEQTKELDQYVCSDCVSDQNVNNLEDTESSSSTITN
ncbi:unnamed protein product [Cuscuta epithymum]|nr:unnamed protein product [Cuscuta epithymum]